MKHYKVVLRDSDRLVSFLAEGHARVTYEVNEWSKAPEIFTEYGYHLLVFTSLKYASAFMNNLCYRTRVVELYEVRVRGIVELPFMGRYSINCLPAYTIPEMLEMRVNWDWPPYTRMVREVKLVKLIK